MSRFTKDLRNTHAQPLHFFSTTNPAGARRGRCPFAALAPPRPSPNIVHLIFFHLHEITPLTLELSSARVDIRDRARHNMEPLFGGSGAHRADAFGGGALTDSDSDSLGGGGERQRGGGIPTATEDASAGAADADDAMEQQRDGEDPADEAVDPERASPMLPLGATALDDGIFDDYGGEGELFGGEQARARAGGHGGEGAGRAPKGAWGRLKKNRIIKNNEEHDEHVPAF